MSEAQNQNSDSTQGDGDKGTDDAAAAAAAGDDKKADGDVKANGAAKPEGLEDKYWDADKGVVLTDALIKSAGDSNTAYRKASDQLARVSKELEGFTAPKEGVPEEPAGYELKLPEGVTIPDDDPLLTRTQAFAHKNGLTHDQFNDLVGGYIEAMVADAPDEGQEKAKLGEYGEARIDRIDKWAAANFDKGDYQRIVDGMMRSEDVEFWERIAEKAGMPSIRIDEPGESFDIPTQESITQMKNDPKYYDTTKRDPEYVAKVNRAVARRAAYNTQQTGRARK